MADRKNLKGLYFGKASAESEVSEDAELFYRTYYDRWDLQSQIDAPGYFLIIGPKGVGKSAASEYIRISMENRYGAHSVFGRTFNLDEVAPGVSPLSAITSKLVSDESTALTNSAWRLFLSLRFLELMINDVGSNIYSDLNIQALVRELHRSGLIESDFPGVLRKARENTMKFSLKGVLGRDSVNREVEEISVNKLGEKLTRIILDASSESHFLICIDGLDRIISSNQAYWGTLASLLQVSDDLHKSFRSARSDMRILVMCRSDVFRSIYFADADKIAGDSALFVDWGAHQTVAADSYIWDYIAAKAEISTDELFRRLPNEVTVGQRGGRPRHIPIAKYLLEFTRSTPREMTMLMRRLQEETPPSGYLTSDRVRAAADSFASRDLLSIVQAEAAGTVAEAVQQKFAELISEFPAASEVQPADIECAVENAGLDGGMAIELSEFLFMAGLLGNYDRNSGHVQFYHRRDTYKFKRRGPWILHRSLMYAFNIPYARDER